MELAFILAVIFGYALLKGILDQRTKERTERLRVLEQALKNPNVDSEKVTVLAQQITQQITQQKPEKPQQPATRGRGMAMLLALGWLTLFSGLGVWVVGAMVAGRDAAAAGILVSLVGFGLVTYPFALRELESRRQA